MAIVMSNNAASTLASGISSGATSFTVASGSTFPALSSGDFTFVTIGTEVIKVTARSGANFTCDQTTASHSSGDTVELRVTSELLNAFSTDEESLPKSGGTMTGNIVMGSNLVDGVDISARDSVLTSTTTTANAALPKAGGTMTGNIAHAGDFKLDVEGELIFDANLQGEGNGILLHDAGLEYGNIYRSSGDLIIKSSGENENLVFKGNDGGSTITALTFDMSALGDAYFNRHVKLTDNGNLVLGGGDDLLIYHDHANQQNKMLSASLPVILGGTTVSLNNGANNQNMLVATQAGAVDLYHNNVKKFETSAAGATLTGNLTVTGTVDGVDIATRDAILTSTTTTAGAALSKAGGTMTGDLILPDNVKLEIGSLSGGDLQIYHDSSAGASYIKDVGTGSLQIAGSSQVNILNGADSEYCAKFITDGAVELYHNNVKKLETTAAGITVTGGATLTGNIAHAGDFTLDVGGDIILDADGAQIKFADAGTVFLEISNESSDAQIYNPIQDKDIKFAGNDGGSAITALTLDMSDAGYATFNAGAHIKGTTLIAVSSDPTLVLRRTGNTAGNGSIDFQGNDGSVDGAITFAGSTAGALQFSTATSNAMTINSNGYVGIGTTGIEAPLHVMKRAAANTIEPLLILDSDKDNHTSGKGGSIVFQDISVYENTAEISAARIGAGAASEVKFKLRNTEIFTIKSDARGLSQFTAKAWIRIDMSNMSVPDSHNVSSVSDISTGRGRVNFSNNLANSSYSIATSNPESYGSGHSSITASSFDLYGYDTNGTRVDIDYAMAHVFGD